MQLEFFDVPSPCVGICQSDQKGLCLGCLRNRDERLNWNSFNSDDKQKVIKRCLQRKKRKQTAGNAKHKPEQIIESIAIEFDNLQPSLLDPPTKNKIDNSNDLDFGDFEL